MAWKMAFFVDYDDCSGVVAVLLWVVMEWSALVCLWGVVGSFGRVLKSAADGTRCR